MYLKNGILMEVLMGSGWNLVDIIPMGFLVPMFFLAILEVLMGSGWNLVDIIPVGFLPQI